MNCGCSGGLFSAMRRDIDRCFTSLFGVRRTSVLGLIRVFILFPGLSVVLLYRVCHYYSLGFRPKFLGTILLTLVYIPFRILGVAFGVEINPRSHIGPGVLINHFGGIHIGPSVMGENCNISHSVTIGRSSRNPGASMDRVAEYYDCPAFGNRVWIGPGAVIAGGIKVGSDSVVAANSLVTRDVPPRAVVMGVPAKTTSYKGSFKQVSYRGMDQDPDRLAAIAESQASEAVESSAE